MLEAYREDLWYSLQHPRVRAGLIAATSAVFIALVVGMVYWWPAWSTVKTLNEQIDQRRRQAVEASFSIKIEQQSKRAALHVEQIEKKLAASGTQVNLVQNLGKLARQFNVRILSETYEKGKAKDGYMPFVHEILLQGNYADLRQFLIALQELPTFTVVQDAVMSRTGDTAVVKAQLRMITYYKAESLSSSTK
jgi:hypothetical protein